MRVVKAFARQAYERDKFERENWEKYSRGRTLMLAHSLFWPISDILCGAQMLFGYTLGALMAINGDDHRRHVPGLRRAARLDHLPDAQPGPPDRADLDRPGVLPPCDRRDQPGPRAAGRGHAPAGRPGEGRDRLPVRVVRVRPDAARAEQHQPEGARRARRSRCSARPARARRRWSTCCRASTSTPTASISWTAWS